MTSSGLQAVGLATGGTRERGAVTLTAFYGVPDVLGLDRATAVLSSSEPQWMPSLCQPSHFL